MVFFLDVILPLPLKDTFTYSITAAEAKFITPGMRVIVPFGKRKRFTAIAIRAHQNPPKAYEPKQIDSIIDEAPVLSEVQLSFLAWMASYYQAPLGLVFRTALPSVMLLESETEIVTHQWEEIPTTLSKNAIHLLQQIQQNSLLSLAYIQQLIPVKNPYPILKELAENGFVSLKEEVYAQYKPKTQSELLLHPTLQSDDALKARLEELSVKTKQYQTFLTFLQQNPPVIVSDFSKINTVSPSSLKTLIKNKVLVKHERVIDRLPTKITPDETLMPLSGAQQKAKEDILDFWKLKDITLLHGVTGSGKTEVYMHLIAKQLAAGKQVLFLVPEISLTTQLMQRLHRFFGQQLAVYHSKYSPQERTETWEKINAKNPKARLILGARSAVLLPFQNLGLVVVDESHETSYKQYDAAPRYHARDAAMVLARMHHAKVLLGTATPSMETYRHAQTGKYGFVSLTTRFKEAQMPEIRFVDLSEAYRKKQVKGHLGQELIDAITETLDAKKQVLLFQNRRGYASFIECSQCAHVPQCQSCDVSLTFHQVNNELRCHYCGYAESYTAACGACGTVSPLTQGLGTQQLEEEIQQLFPSARVARMDLDTTRKKHAHNKLITAFAAHEVDILIGTQMITKGLDFEHVTLVGVLSADNFLHFPDFRAHERAFQVLTQVAGRAGRVGDSSKVLIQTFQPNHPVLGFVQRYDYPSFFEQQIQQREQFGYPPFVRMIRIELKHKNMATLIQAGEWLKKGLQERFAEVLGPAPPPVARVRNFYILHTLLKLPLNASQSAAKDRLDALLNSFAKIGAFKQVRVAVDVDPQ